MIENLFTYSYKNYFFKRVCLYKYFFKKNTKFIFWALSSYLMNSNKKINFLNMK